MNEPLVGAVEAGGTKFVCAVARSVREVVAEVTISTTTPDRTLAAVIDFFSSLEAEEGQLAAIGVGTFGPVDLRRHSPTRGRLLTTPKIGWSGVDLYGTLRRRFAVPVAIDTDVNVAALAEAQYGAGCGHEVVAYITVGTGIGGGLVINGQRLHGALHPEIGHLRVERHTRDADFVSVCPFHDSCVEGLASGPAVVKRWGVPLDQLACDHEAFTILGSYLGQLAATLILVTSAGRIVFGGGVMKNRELLQPIRINSAAILNNYLQDSDLAALEQRIVAPGLGDRSGIAGAITLAMSCLK